MLIATIRTSQIQLNLIVGHAPRQAYPVDEQTQWWNDLQQQVASLGGPEHTILMLDSSVHLHALSDRVGMSYGKLDSEAALGFADLLQQADLFLQAAWPAYNDDVRAATVMVNGSGTTVDFVAIPADMFCSAASISGGLDLSMEDIEHFAVHADVQIKKRLFVWRVEEKEALRAQPAERHASIEIHCIRA